MNVAEAVGRVLASLGVDTAFGVVGSGNFHVTNALIEHGVRYVAARHEEARRPWPTPTRASAATSVCSASIRDRASPTR